VDLLAENLADYRARVHRCDADGLAATIAGLLAERGSTSVVVPTGLAPEWLAATDVTRVPDRLDSTPAELDRVDSVVTACAVAIAETGTIVLDGGPDQGRRRITLVPDHHICVVRVPVPGRVLRAPGTGAPRPVPPADLDLGPLRDQ
jgi:L-lactate dehydrogenase complex protein LldG